MRKTWPLQKIKLQAVLGKFPSPCLPNSFRRPCAILSFWNYANALKFGWFINSRTLWTSSLLHENCFNTGLFKFNYDDRQEKNELSCSCCRGAAGYTLSPQSRSYCDQRPPILSTMGRKKNKNKNKAKERNTVDARTATSENSNEASTKNNTSKSANPPEKPASTVNTKKKDKPTSSKSTDPELPRSLSESLAGEKSTPADPQRSDMKQARDEEKARGGILAAASAWLTSVEPPLKKATSERSASDYRFTSYHEDWEAICALPLEEKRKRYKCGQFHTLENIPTWELSAKLPDFRRLNEKYEHYPMLPPYSVDAELNAKVSIFVGDITALEIDCIVNAANSSLLGGGGVDGAIHRAAGPSLLKECKTLRGCRTGEAKITKGYKLPARHVIHTVGPMSADEEELSSCYSKSLQIAMDNDLRSIAFPCIATGIYGFPNDKAVRVVLPLVRSMLSLENNRDKFDRIIFCLFLQKDIDLYSHFLQKVFPLE